MRLKEGLLTIKVSLKYPLHILLLLIKLRLTEAKFVIAFNFTLHERIAKLKRITNGAAFSLNNKVLLTRTHTALVKSSALCRYLGIGCHLCH